MNYADKALVEDTLFALYQSKSFENTKEALEKAVDSINARLLKTKGEWTRAKLLETKQAIKDEILKSYGGLFATLEKEIGIVSSLIGGVYLADATINSIPTKVIQNITSGNMNILGYTFSDLIKTTSENHARQLSILLGREVAKGSSLDTIVKEMLTKNDSLTQSQLKSVIYTTIKQAREDATSYSYAQLEKEGLVEAWESLGVLDSRTSEICRQLDGVVYKMAYKDIPNKPPRHFNCRSRLIPATISDLRASQDGQISNMTYTQWFETKDATFQRKVLGRTKYDLYKQGRYKVSSLADMGRVTITLDDIKTMLK